MGMLSLAGIVSGAGAGAGKSLRQAQTYLNWEMLQEERGKLELQRDERVNENIIARESRHRGQVRADLEESQSEPFLAKKANADATLAELTLANRARLRPLIGKDIVDQAEADRLVTGQLRPGRKLDAIERLEDTWALDEKTAKHVKDVTIANLNDPQNEEIFKLTLKQAEAQRSFVDGATVNRSEYLKEHPEVAKAYRNIANLNQTEAQQLQLEDLQFKALHRDEDRVAANQKRLADIKDHEQNKIGHLLTTSDRALQDLTKSISAAVDPAEKTLLQARYGEELQLNKDISARAREIYGLRPARTAPVIGGPLVAHDASDASMEATVPRYSKGIGILGSTANK